MCTVAHDHPAERQRVVLVSGLSGAGRASILRALEDVGYEAIDNPPTEAIEDLVADGPPDPSRRVAVGVDVRSRGFNVDALLDVLARLKGTPGLRTELVFAWADEAVLLRRFTETRRRHPLSPQGRVSDGIAAEQAQTAPLHAAADLVLDTSALSLAGLRQWIDRRFGPDARDDPQAGLSLAVTSFAFPAGLPREADMVLDARFLRNPHYDPVLRPRTGLDAEVAAYVAQDPDFDRFFQKTAELLQLVLPRFVQEGKKYATIAIGCTGGRHRSVAIAEKLGSHLTQAGWRVTVTHRELAREGAPADGASRSPVPAPPTPTRIASHHAGSPGPERPLEA
ncbi:MAG: RNase adaptor protein RapZ [Rhodospirillales bacterium 70-18]|nr:RNase adapter RapZ [Rhodospirillales bacterium]OJY65616.1 MAG: RNase adaptor protein RapZ [Rhodospirillales bacterium 70-18]